ncbi:MAG: GIY-YIG nuclease family protein [Gammaproteobacteria bacterium]|nr:GIY-YIG nuclease family protein [Gammaproteobacteria bacterium]
MADWFVYVLRCADGSYYTGITTDLERRIAEHNHDKRGAAYTRARRPVSLVYRETCDSRSDAARREHRIRKMNREQKQDLILGKASPTTRRSLESGQ